MKQVEAFEEVDAPPEVVWEVLLEFDSYPEWNPLVGSIEGLAVEADSLEVRIDLPGSHGGPFSLQRLVVEEHRRLAWLCRLLVPFAFDAYHEFRLEPIGDGRRTRLLQRETFRGALVPALLEEERVERGFRRLNEAVRERAERRVGVTA